MKPVCVDIHIERLAALKKCAELVGASANYFVTNTRLNARLSGRQKQYISILAWRYRGQLAPRLVPENKPKDLTL